MPFSKILCARCGTENHGANRFCTGCRIPLGSIEPDADAGTDILCAFEAPGPSTIDVDRLLREVVARTGFPSSPARQGWRITVTLEDNRRQLVYLGHVGTDITRHPIVGFVSVCGPANDRDARILLKVNANAVHSHFAIRTLRGEEYFVVIRNVRAEDLPELDAAELVRGIAESADCMEGRLMRGKDLY